jgi:hypothetical protein
MKTKTKIKRKWGKVKKYYSENRGALWFAFFAGITAGAVITQSILQPHKAPLEPTGQVKQVEVVAVQAKEREFCNDVINCIRDVGEELKVPNNDIMTMIRIAKCESGYRAEALGINTNKTVDRGVFQINSIHKSLSNSQAFDYQTNIRFAYKLYKDQSFNPWNSSRKCWNK